MADRNGMTLNFVLEVPKVSLTDDYWPVWLVCLIMVNCSEFSYLKIVNFLLVNVDSTLSSSIWAQVLSYHSLIQLLRISWRIQWVIMTSRRSNWSYLEPQLHRVLSLLVSFSSKLKILPTNTPGVHRGTPNVYRSASAPALLYPKMCLPIFYLQTAVWPLVNIT